MGLKVLDGSVRREGDEVRISVELVGTQDGFRRWADQFDRRLENVLSVQQAIARSVAEQLEVELGPRAEQRLVRRGDPDPDAYDLYLRKLYMRNNPFVDDNLRRTVDRFHEAVALDSTFAAAWAALGTGYNTLGQFRMMEPVEAYDLAERYARRALELDPALADAHHALGLVRWSRDYDYAARSGRSGRPSSWPPTTGRVITDWPWCPSDRARPTKRWPPPAASSSWTPGLLAPVRPLGIHYRRREFDEARRQTEAMMEMVPGDPSGLAFPTRR